MIRLRCALAAGLLALTMGACAGTAMAGTGSETLWLDSYEASNDGAAGPVTTSTPLAPGMLYLAEVTGTFSAWQASDWLVGTPCGVPEPAPMFSLGGRTGTVGLD